MGGGYGGRLVDWVAGRFKFRLSVVPRPRGIRQFTPLPRRWFVERTFGWLNHSQHLSESCEQLTQTDEAWVCLAMIRIMARQLA